MKPKRIRNPHRESDYVYNEFANNFEFFLDQNNIPFAVAWKKREVIRTGKDELCTAIRNLHFANGGTLSSKSLNDAYETIKAQIKLCNDYRAVIQRVHSDSEGIYYVIGNQIVKITESDASIIKKGQVNFFIENDQNSVMQSIPALNTPPNELPKLLGVFFNLSSEQEVLLFTYIISCFVPHINHPVLFLHGAQGSAKSTALRMIKRLVDPNKKDLFAMPQKEDDLYTILGNNYFVPLDNIGRITQRFSDLLCQAATDGTVSKRKLYTDNAETIINLRSIVAISGVEMSITRSDLLDRSITVMLDRIPESERKTEGEIWESFELLEPQMLGAIFNTLSKALYLVKRRRLEKQFRMADFALWGYCIAEALYDGGGKIFLHAYRENIRLSAANLIAANPLVYSLDLLMQEQTEWKGTPTDLLHTLQQLYMQNCIDNKFPYGFPTNAILLSKKISLIISDLKSLNIEVEIGRGKARYIIIRKVEK